MSNKIIIVESPKKALVISKMFKDYIVLASKGHIKDLRKSYKNFGYNLKTFEPEFDITKNGTLFKKELANLAKSKRFSKDTICYLATDSDREGEAIAFHIKELLLFYLNNSQIKRISVREITKSMIIRAIDNSTDIDLGVVSSQFARRVADRLIGFTVSALMRQYMASNVGAGRVQIPALRIIEQNSSKFISFKSTEYFVISAQIKDKIIELENKFKTFSEANNAININNLSFAKDNLNSTIVSGKVILPLKTVSLQKEAQSRFGFEPSQTMLIAQQLYEGCQIDNNLEGLISYIRTDSTRISNEFLNENKKILESFGKLNLKNLSLINIGFNVQDAHEAIRPIKLTLTPEYVSKFLTLEQSQIYGLVYYNLIASCIEVPIFIDTKVIFKNEDLVLSIKNRSIKEYGYLKNINLLKFFAPDIDKNLNLINIDEITVEKLEILKKYTKAPKLLNESSLIQSLEKLGIGRPATFSSILPKLLSKNFVSKRDKKYLITSMGNFALNELLNYFEKIFDFEFTSILETDLDSIASKHTTFFDVLNKLYQQVSKDSVEFKLHIENILTGFFNCFKCGCNGNIFKGKFGLYLKCSSDNSCGNYLVYIKNLNPNRIALVHNFKNIFLAKNCLKCNSFGIVLIKKYKYSLFCLNCKNSENLIISADIYNNYYRLFFVEQLHPFKTKKL